MKASKKQMTEAEALDRLAEFIRLADQRVYVKKGFWKVVPMRKYELN